MQHFQCNGSHIETLTYYSHALVVKYACNLCTIFLSPSISLGIYSGYPELGFPADPFNPVIADFSDYRGDPKTLAAGLSEILCQPKGLIPKAAFNGHAHC